MRPKWVVRYKGADLYYKNAIPVLSRDIFRVWFYAYIPPSQALVSGGEIARK